MARFTTLATFLVVAFIASASSTPDDLQFLADIVVIDDINTLLRDNPQLTAVPMKRSLERGLIRYTAGSRVGGDQLVASGGDGTVWSSNRDVQLSIVYPPSGTGAIVSYVDCLVDQVCVVTKFRIDSRKIEFFF